MIRPRCLLLTPLLLASVACGSASSEPQATPPTSTSVALPGDCVEPFADATVRQAEELAVLGDIPDEVSGAPDVDGDGTADRMFRAGAAVTTSTVVYVMRGACGHFVGDIGQSPGPVGTNERHHGLLDLMVPDSTMCEGARCGCEYGEMWFRFDGTTYQLDELASRHSAETACPDE